MAASARKRSAPQALPSNSLPDDAITTGQAARLAHVHIGSVHRWIATGKLRAWRVLGRYKVSEAAVRDLIAPVRVEPAKAVEAVGMSHAEAVRYLREAGLRVGGE